MLTGNQGKSVLLLLGAVLFWSGNNVVAKAIIVDVPPYSFTFLRWLIASLIMLPFTWSYVRRNSVSIFRIYAQYEPMRVFFSAAVVLGIAALIPFTLFFIYWVQGDGAGHVQSLIFGAVLFNAAVVMGALAVIGDLMHAQRIMSQRIFERVRRVELELGVPPSHYEPGAAPTGQAATTGAHSAPSPIEHRAEIKQEEPTR